MKSKKQEAGNLDINKIVGDYLPPDISPVWLVRGIVEELGIREDGDTVVTGSNKDWISLFLHMYHQILIAQKRPLNY